MHIGECIFNERKKWKITQRELGRRAGVSSQMISKIESLTCNPTVNMIIRISSALDILASELVKEADGYQDLAFEFQEIESKTFNINDNIINLVHILNTVDKDFNYDINKLALENKDFLSDLNFSVINIIKNRLDFYDKKDVK